MPAFETPQRGPLGAFQADTIKAIRFTKAGTATVAILGTDQRWYNDTDRPLKIVAVRASVGTAPTGATLIVDIKKNGTSIYATTTANRPTIAISGKTALGGTPDTTAVAAGQYLDADVLQIGSTVAGADLTVDVLLSTN